MEKVLISACLLGTPCRYDGKSKPCAAARQLKEKYELIPVCPESLGGLAIPRQPSEIVGDRVLSKGGEDITEQFRSGAMRTLQIAGENRCTLAVLKEKSPSCGSGIIHDGSFGGGLTEGWGITAALLRDNAIRVIGESQINKLLEDG